MFHKIYIDKIEKYFAAIKNYIQVFIYRKSLLRLSLATKGMYF